MSNVATLPVPPVRETVSPEEWEARVDLAACYRLLARYKYDDLTATHTSLSVPGSGGKHFLINPRGILFEQITASSLVKIDCDGNPVIPSPHAVNFAGFVIHSAIHAARADAACVMHTHTVAGMAVSMQADGLLPASQHACFFTDNIGYHDLEHMEDGVDGRDALARDLGDHPALIMRNHGLLVCGRTVAEAFWLTHTLERACAAQIAAMSGGARLTSVSAKTASWFSDLLSGKGLLRNAAAEGWPSMLQALDDTDPSFRN